MEYNTPKNIMEYSQSEILPLVNDTDARVKTNKENRLKLINIIYQLYGYKLDPDILLAMLAEPTSKLIIATAGGGKTTMSQIQLILEKIVRRNSKGQPLAGSRMLCLVYNTQNVEQMKRKHMELVNTLYAKGITGVTIDRDITCRTMHSFCLEWRNEYTAQMGLLNYVQLSDDGQRKMFGTIVKILAKKYELEETKFNVNTLMSLYNLTHELMLPYADMESLTKYEEVSLDIDIVVDLFNAYDNMKKIKRVYDYTDMLSKMLTLLQTNEEARTRIQEHYDYIVVDEFQDFTPIMSQIVRYVQGKDTPLLCIGDEDQCIYNFRGADINNILEFTQKFPDGAVYSLGANRRCKRNIFNAAHSVIEQNTLRFDKPMFCIKDEGNIELRSYYSQMGQLINVVDHLKNLTESELNSTIICYREQKSSIRLTSLLAEHNIPFHVMSGYDPYSHELFTHITDVLDLLYLAKDRQYLTNLYKITEMTRNDCYNVLQYDAKSRKFKTENDYKHFLDRSYGKYSSRVSFLKIMKQLDTISSRMLKEPMCNYFDDIWLLFKRYFWNWKKQQNENEEIDSYFEEQIIKLFKSKLTYEYFIQEHDLQRNRIKANNVNKAGVAVSTFHKLKGLEYNNVFIIDLSDDIFPNYSRIELQKYQPNTELQLKESEVRLMFVAMTRAINNLYLYYNANNPSIYVEWLLNQQYAERERAMLSTNATKTLDVFSTNTTKTANTSSLLTTEEDIVDDVVLEVDDSLLTTEEDTVDDLSLTTEEDDIVLEVDDLYLTTEEDTTDDLYLTTEDEVSSSNNPSTNLRPNSVNTNTEVKNGLSNTDDLLTGHITQGKETTVMGSFSNLSTTLTSDPDNFLAGISNAKSSKTDSEPIKQETSTTFNSDHFLASVLDRL